MTNEHDVTVYKNPGYTSIVCNTCGWSKAIYRAANFETEKIAHEIATFHRERWKLHTLLEYL